MLNRQVLDLDAMVGVERCTSSCTHRELLATSDSALGLRRL